jgi:hypothetical protein
LESVDSSDRSSLDLLTIGLLVFFISLIVIVAVMLLLPIITA